jgi:hypothetical protein
MYWWAIFVGLFMFGSPAAYGIATQWFKHKENMQDKRNEELRLHLQLEQARNEHFGAQELPRSANSAPKDASWEEQVQTPYEMGYQQIEQQQ